MIVYLDSTMIYSSWKDQSARTRTKTVNVAGGTHTITVNYYEHNGEAVAKVSWIKQ
jgi:hypothetical protein